MDKKHAISVAGLALAAVLALALAGSGTGRLHGWTEENLPNPAGGAEASPEAEAARQALRTYFMDRYSEAACSAVYADLTHDGVEELLVLEIENSRAGEPVTLHGDPVSADEFTRAQVTVLRAEEDGAVLPVYTFVCGAEHSLWGELYLKKTEGADHLLWYAPYTAAGRSDFQLALFSLDQEGAPLDRVRRQIAFPVDGGAPRAGDAGEAEIAAFIEQAEMLLEDAEPVIVYDVVHDPAAGTDGPRRFAYLDALFTTY